MHSILIIVLLVLASYLHDVKAATCAAGNACQNGAICVDNPLNTYICVCTPQWTGDFCDYPAGSTNVCSVNSCYNGGTCSPTSNNGFICICPPNYTGSFCQTLNIAPTAAPQNTRCLNGGTCVFIPPYTYQCICPYGYTGSRCEIFFLG